MWGMIQLQLEHLTLLPACLTEREVFVVVVACVSYVLSTRWLWGVPYGDESLEFKLNIQMTNETHTRYPGMCINQATTKERRTEKIKIIKSNFIYLFSKERSQRNRKVFNVTQTRVCKTNVSRN